MSAPKKYCVCAINAQKRPDVSLCFLQLVENIPDDQKCMLQSSLDIHSTLGEAS